jgi:hypothetical protein
MKEKSNLYFALMPVVQKRFVYADKTTPPKFKF